MKLYYPYKAFCASRRENHSQSHFLVSMNGFGAKGFRVENCDEPLKGSLKETFCTNATLWENYLHYQLQYRTNNYLAWEKCLSFKRNGYNCPTEEPIKKVCPECKCSTCARTQVANAVKPSVNPPSVSVEGRPVTEQPLVTREPCFVPFESIESTITLGMNGSGFFYGLFLQQ